MEDLQVTGPDPIFERDRIVIKYSRRTDTNRDLAPTRRSCQTAAHGPCIEFCSGTGEDPR